MTKNIRCLLRLAFFLESILMYCHNSKNVGISLIAFKRIIAIILIQSRTFHSHGILRQKFSITHRLFTTKCGIAQNF